MGAFKVLLELFDVLPQLPGGPPLRVRATLRGWKFFTRAEAVTALRLTIGCSGRDPMHAVFVTLGMNRGDRPVSSARYFGVANPVRRNIEI